MRHFSFRALAYAGAYIVVAGIWVVAVRVLVHVVGDPESIILKFLMSSDLLIGLPLTTFFMATVGLYYYFSNKGMRFDEGTSKDPDRRL